MALLEIRGLKKYFPVRSGVFGRTQGQVKAIDGVSLDPAATTKPPPVRLNVLMWVAT